MKRKDVNLSQITLLHDSNIKYLQGKMPEPINDAEMLHNLEQQWLTTQPKLWMWVLVIGLGVVMLGIGIGFWVFIIASFVLDYQTFLAQAPLEMLGVLFINAIILGMTGLCGWGGLYLFEFIFSLFRDKDKHLKPDAIFEKMLIEGNFIKGQILLFLDTERKQVIFHVDGSRYRYSLLETSKLEAGDFVLALQWEQFIVLL